MEEAKNVEETTSCQPNATGGIVLYPFRRTGYIGAGGKWLPVFNKL
jgi:hypothetical protein